MLIFFGGFEMPSSYYFSIEKGVAPPLRSIPLSFHVVSPLMLLGGILVGWGDRRKLPLMLLVLAYAVGLTIFYPLGHYRAPMLPAAIPLAAYALTRIVNAILAGPARHRVVLVSGLAACTLLAFAPDIARWAGVGRLAGKEDDLTMFHYNRGLFLLGEKRYEEALATFGKAVEANPELKQGWEGKATVAGVRGELASERLYLERALEVSLADPMTEEEAKRLFRGSSSHRAAGRPADAEDLLWKAIRKHPHSVLPRIWLALHTADGAAPEVWKGHARNAVTLRPEEALLWVRLGMNLLLSGQEALGLFLAETAAERGEENERVIAALGDAYFAAGRLGDAAREFRRLLARSPGSEDAVIGSLSRSLRGLGRLEEAEAEVETGLRRFPKSVPLLLERAHLLLEGGEADRETILRAVREAVRRGAELPPELEALLEER